MSRRVSHECFGTDRCTDPDLHAVLDALHEVNAEHDALAGLVQRQKEAIRELSSELVEVAQRSPQALTLLQLEAVVAERDALAARLAAVEALFAGGPDTPCRTTWPDGVECVEVPMDDLRAALEGDR